MLTEKTEAEKELACFNLSRDASRANRLTDDFANSLSGRELERITLRGAVEIFLGSFKGQNAESSLVSYRSRCNAFLEHFHASDTVPLIGDITGELIEQFLNAIKARTSASTANDLCAIDGAVTTVLSKRNTGSLPLKLSALVGRTWELFFAAK